MLTFRNALAQARIRRTPSANLYQLGYATSFYRHVFRRGASIAEASADLRATVSAMIRDGNYNYDLEVLEKRGSSIRVRDARARELLLVDLVTNSYNDLDQVDETREELARYVRDEPLSSCLSRKIAGRYIVHHELEDEIADFLGYGAAVLGTCGYISQLSTMFSLFREGDIVFSDEHNHSSLVDGCRLSKARVIVYRHLDYDHLEQLLRRHRRRYNAAGIVSDGVFSAKGAIADLGRITALGRRFRCVSVIDDTHGIGAVGRHGRGIIDVFDDKPDVLTGGFSKALGAFGGFAVAGRDLAVAIDHFGRQNVNTSHLSPVAAAQSLINLRYYRAHHDRLAAELAEKVHAFNHALSPAALSCYPDPEQHIHPIFCFSKTAEKETLASLNELIEEGFLPSFFPYPVCPHPTLRFSLHRLLTTAQLERLARILARMDLAPEVSRSQSGGPGARVLTLPQPAPGSMVPAALERAG